MWANDYTGGAIHSSIATTAPPCHIQKTTDSIEKWDSAENIWKIIGHCGKKINKGHLKKIKIITRRFKLDLL
jgi:hypothetical protein